MESWTRMVPPADFSRFSARLCLTPCMRFVHLAPGFILIHATHICPIVYIRYIRCPLFPRFSASCHASCPTFLFLSHSSRPPRSFLHSAVDVVNQSLGDPAKIAARAAVPVLYVMAFDRGMMWHCVIRDVGVASGLRPISWLMRTTRERLLRNEKVAWSLTRDVGGASVLMPSLC